MIILFLGRSTEGVLADARREFPPEADALVLSRDNDQLPPPAGVDCIPASRFSPVPGVRYVVVANCGTTQQLLPAVKKLVEAQAEFSAWDLQRDGKTRVW